MSRWFIVLVGAGLLNLITSAFAHHSVPGVFDAESPVEITGVITKVEWINPHVFIHLETANDDGTVTLWEFETAPTQFFRNAGVSKSMLEGDGGIVTISGIRAHDKTKTIAWIRRITFADGRFIQTS